MAGQDPKVEDVKRSGISMAMDWGKSPLPPTILATLLTALHARPFQPLPMLFPPVLLFSTYLNLNAYPVDSAGLTAAWSGLYLLLANRRRVKGNSLGQRIGSKFGARGLTRGSAMVLAGVNVVGCGLAYGFGKRENSEKKI
ncbi:hypothetical protein GLAREA_08972 [Glarea lozoyensis ATCC 20868]|uniref:Uncharacterized protein n=1 Tax=Glarea lozoyensis (strain ATCC 20868 / MF5171) TaxID=1116229 RepID=S3DI57_GLAL2|nr:uncharacterized protein GLAREA_08972 [Glarea lozoyensis ATCC 20868]EPE36809.1 hypothetical protein GLAREA_08972 [Glarea lozoyensis ATCC 20868]